MLSDIVSFKPCNREVLICLIRRCDSCSIHLGKFIIKRVRAWCIITENDVGLIYRELVFIVLDLLDGIRDENPDVVGRSSCKSGFEGILSIGKFSCDIDYILVIAHYRNIFPFFIHEHHTVVLCHSVLDSAENHAYRIVRGVR